MTSEHQKHKNSNHQNKEAPQESEKEIEKGDEHTSSSAITMKQKHEAFVRALEQYGSLSSACDIHSSSLCWEKMSFSLGWSVQEVKVYAYRYFVLLQQHSESKKVVTRPVTPLPESPMHIKNTPASIAHLHPRQHSGEIPSKNHVKYFQNQHNIQKNSKEVHNQNQIVDGGNGVIDDWTEDDRILMDTLLVAYEGVDHHNLMRQENNQNYWRENANPKSTKVKNRKISLNEEFKWEQIAAMLPGKTADDVKKRYMSLKRQL